MELREALARFEADDLSDRSKATLTNYRSAIRSLIAHGITDTRHLRRARLAEWVSARRAEGASAATINTQLGGILSVCSWLETRGRFPLSRLLRIRRLRVRRPQTAAPVFLTKEEIARLRAAARRISPRLDLAICLSIFGGLRLNELRRLVRSDLVLDPPDGLPYVRVRGRTHNRNERTAPLPKGFAKWLRGNLLVPERADAPIFPQLNTLSSDGMQSRETLKAWFRQARDAAGLPHATWFTCRHCFGSHLRSRGVELSLISGFMGNTIRVCEKHYAALAPGGNAAIDRGFADLWESLETDAPPVVAPKSAAAEDAA